MALGRGETAYFSVAGMWCSGCAVAAERVLGRRPGVLSVDVSYAAERGRIQYDPKAVDPAAALDVLGRMGYDARLLTQPGRRARERLEERTLLHLVVAAVLSMQVMLIYILRLYPLYSQGRFDLPEVEAFEYAVWALTTPVLFYSGISFLRGAWQALRARTATMDTLVAVGTLSAYTYSVWATVRGGQATYFDSVGMIIAVILLGRYLEVVGGARARKDVRQLLTLQPDRASRRAADAWAVVRAEELETGDVVLARPGERIAADGEVVEGAAAVDESLLTGESAAVEKKVGALVFAGSLVADEALVYRVTEPPGSSRLAQIAGLVQETLAAKAPVQRLADRASAALAAVIVLAAAGVLRGLVPGKRVRGHGRAAGRRRPRRGLPVCSRSGDAARALRGSRTSHTRRRPRAQRRGARDRRDDHPRRLRQDRHGHRRGDVGRRCRRLGGLAPRAAAAAVPRQRRRGALRAPSGAGDRRRVPAPGPRGG